jgi:hypothetical protein
MVDVLERGPSAQERWRHTRARAIAALSVGGMVLARSMDDRTLADEVRDACISVALKLGGWENESRAEGANSRRVGLRGHRALVHSLFGKGMKRILPFILTRYTDRHIYV